MSFDRREAGERLREFVHVHKGPRSMDELARDAGLRGRQTLNEWFAGQRDVYLGSLQQLAAALGVRRVDLVAAYDGVTAPEQQETPPPEWAEAFMTRDEVRGLVDEVQAAVTAEIHANRAVMAKAVPALEGLAGLADLLADYRRELERTVQQRDGVPPAKPGRRVRERQSSRARSAGS